MKRKKLIVGLIMVLSIFVHCAFSMSSPRKTYAEETSVSSEVVESSVTTSDDFEKALEDKLEEMFGKYEWWEANKGAIYMIAGGVIAFLGALGGVLTGVSKIISASNKMKEGADSLKVASRDAEEERRKALAIQNQIKESEEEIKSLNRVIESQNSQIKAIGNSIYLACCSNEDMVKDGRATSIRKELENGGVIDYGEKTID